MILIDERQRSYKGGYWSHLVSDTSIEELHKFAIQLGLKREWFQGNSRIPHYDLKSSAKWQEAVRLGAMAVTTRDMLWRLRGKFEPCPTSITEKEEL